MTPNTLLEALAAMIRAVASDLEREAYDLTQNWEGFDTGHRASDALTAKARTLHAMAQAVAGMVELEVR